MGIIGAKWKPCLIDAVREHPKRPSELHREIPEAIPRVLDQQLRELEEHGIVEKKVYAEIPLRSEYSLTELGRSLLPLIDALDDWGEEHRAWYEALSEFHARPEKL